MLVIILAIILIVYVVNKDKQKKRRVICDGCGVKIDGKFIRVTEADLSQPLDYCSEQCKIDHIDRDRIKFAELEIE